MSLGNGQDLIEGLPAVIAPNGILLLIADMGVCGDENLDRVRAILPITWDGEQSVCKRVSEGPEVSGPEAPGILGSVFSEKLQVIRGCDDQYGHTSASV